MDKPAAAAETTTLSTKGQVILPKAVRERHRWQPGTQFTVEDTTDGLVLKPAALFPVSKPDDVYGCLRYRGPAKSVEEMNAGIAAEVKRRHARGRY